MEYMTYEKAIKCANNGSKLRRAKWVWGHIAKVINPSCKLYNKLIKGSVINGYREYQPTEEDKNANDWFIVEV